MSTVRLLEPRPNFGICRHWHPRRFNKSWQVNTFFIFCLAFIGSVSAWDAWLVEANPCIVHSEQNSICRRLIELAPGSKIYFFIAKGISSTCVLVTLSLLFWKRYQHAMLITTVVTLFQLGLLIYLYFGDAKYGGLPNFSILFEESSGGLFALRYR